MRSKNVACRGLHVGPSKVFPHSKMPRDADDIDKCMESIEEFTSPEMWPRRTCPQSTGPLSAPDNPFYPLN